MDHRCLVLTGRLLDGQDAATAHARLAAAFGMELAGFRERVFERAPLIIRRRLEPDAADAQAAQLRGVPSKFLSFPDEGHWVTKPQNSLVWQKEFFGWLDKWLK